ncbi:hypothetical protein OKW41_005917 [Paraburkholderia sp. UCT70]
MYQRSIAAWAPRIKCLFKCIQNEASSHRRTDAPTDNPSGKHVDHERHVEPALPRRDIGEIKNPELVWPVCPDLPVDPIQRARGRRIGNGRANTFALALRHANPVASSAVRPCSEPPRYAPGSSASRLYPLRRRSVVHASRSPMGVGLRSPQDKRPAVPRCRADYMGLPGDERLGILRGVHRESLIDRRASKGAEGRGRGASHGRAQCGDRGAAHPVACEAQHADDPAGPRLRLQLFQSRVNSEGEGPLSPGNLLNLTRM